MMMIIMMIINSSDDDEKRPEQGREQIPIQQVWGEVKRTINTE